MTLYPSPPIFPQHTFSHLQADTMFRVDNYCHLHHGHQHERHRKFFVVTSYSREPGLDPLLQFHQRNALEFNLAILVIDLAVAIMSTDRCRDLMAELALGIDDEQNDSRAFRHHFRRARHQIDRFIAEITAHFPIFVIDENERHTALASHAPLPYSGRFCGSDQTVRVNGPVSHSTNFANNIVYSDL